MLDCRNGPALWETLIEALDIPGAVIAGGCIRDYVLGHEPKDIDLFVPIGNRQEFEELIATLNDSSVWSLEVLDGQEYRVHDPHSVIGVAEGEAIGLPVNIIARCSQLPTSTLDVEGFEYHGTADNWSLINSFDFGILQWSFSSTSEGIVCTTQALMDLAARTATLTHNSTYDQSIERYKRFNTRCPGALRLVDPYGSFQ
jgi:hypothetical protein